MVELVSKIYNPSCLPVQPEGEHCREEKHAGHNRHCCNRRGSDSVDPSGSSGGSYSTSFTDSILGKHWQRFSEVGRWLLQPRHGSPLLFNNVVNDSLPVLFPH